jgi:hypothetical protein
MFIKGFSHLFQSTLFLIQVKRKWSYPKDSSIPASLPFHFTPLIGRENHTNRVSTLTP